MIRRLLRLPVVLVAENADLVLVGVGLVALRSLLGPGHALTRDDLLPWLALAMALAGALRRGGWGRGPAPGLSPRRDGLGGLCDRLARAAVPFALLRVHDATLGGREAWYAAGAVVAATLALAWLGRRDGLTAWDPPGPSDALLTALGVVAVILPITLASAASALMRGSALTAELDAILYVGSSFFGMGLASGNPRSLRQRLRLGTPRGGGLAVPLFRPLLALAGTPIGLLPLLVLFERGGDLRAHVAAAHVLVWAAVLWPRRADDHRACLLREVAPAGGRDPAHRGPVGFDAPPEGALRLDPLHVKETHIVHVWVVPVRDPRLERLDDPVEVPWRRPVAPPQAHVLGQASFEPEPGTLRRQAEEITVRVQASGDMIALRAGDAATRRLVVLRAYVPDSASARRARGAYRWDDGVPLVCRQVVDGNTTTVTLRDGDLIIASSEGVPRAYELCIGAGGVQSGITVRTPQIEDYLGRGA